MRLPWLLLAVWGAAFAQGGWTLVGPWGGNVKALASTADGKVFACSEAGLHRSDDTATGWIPVTPLPGGCSSLLAHQGALYALAPGDGLVGSRDEGVTWRKLAPAGERRMHGFAVVGTKLYALGEAGLYVSFTRGDTWTRVSLPEGNYESVMAVDLVLIVTRSLGEGALLTRDLGESWEPLQLDPDAYEPRFLADEGFLLARTNAVVRRSTDHGKTWEITKGLPEFAEIQALKYWRGKWWLATGEKVYVTGNRLDWADASGLKFPARTSHLAVFQDHLVAGSEGAGLAYAGSAAGTVEFNRGFSARSLDVVVADGANLGAIGRAGFCRGMESGSFWAPCFTTPGLDTVRFQAGAMRGEQALFSSTAGFHLFPHDPKWFLYPRPRPDDDLAPGGVAALPNGWLAGLLVGSIPTEDIGTGRDWGGPWRSVDGKDWTLTRMGWPSSNGYADQMRVAASGSGLVLAAAGNAGIYRSTHEGGTWEAANQGLGARAGYPGQYAEVTSLAIGGAWAYAGTEAGRVFRSRDAGRTWQMTSLDLVASLDSTLTDNYSSKPFPVAITGIAIDGRRVFASGWGAVYYSDDEGEHWTSVREPWLLDGVVSLVSGTGRVYAHTQHAGIWALPTGQDPKRSYLTRPTSAAPRPRSHLLRPAAGARYDIRGRRLQALKPPPGPVFRRPQR